jgi:hypothetical protein
MKKYILLAVSIVALAPRANAQCWVQIATGDSHCIGIKKDSTLWGWGINYSYQLGDSTIIGRNTPKQMSNKKWRYVEACSDGNFAIDNAGKLWVCGGNLQYYFGTTAPYYKGLTQIGTDSNWAKICAAIDGYTLALKTNGTLWACGRNSYGQLGMGNTTNLTAFTQIGTDTTWVDVAVGNQATAALKKNGTLWAWGVNSLGNLGDGTLIDRHSPVQIGTDTNWKTISFYEHGLGVKTNGTFWGWGHEVYGALGEIGANPTQTPKQIGSDTNWLKVFAGVGYVNNCSFAIKKDGSLWVAGNNANGQLGDGTTLDKNVFTHVGAGITFQQVSCENRHVSAIAKSGELYSWGVNDQGQLGIGTTSTTDQLTPLMVGNFCAPLSNAQLAIGNAQLQVYPNPATNHIILQYLTDLAASVSLYDVYGKEVLHQPILHADIPNRLDVARLPSGLYMYKVVFGNGAVAMGKVQIEK